MSCYLSEKLLYKHTFRKQIHIFFKKNPTKRHLSRRFVGKSAFVQLIKFKKFRQKTVQNLVLSDFSIPSSFCLEYFTQSIVQSPCRERQRLCCLWQRTTRPEPYRTRGWFQGNRLPGDRHCRSRDIRSGT